MWVHTVCLFLCRSPRHNRSAHIPLLLRHYNTFSFSLLDKVCSRLRIGIRCWRLVRPTDTRESFSSFPISMQSTWHPKSLSNTFSLLPTFFSLKMVLLKRKLKLKLFYIFFFTLWTGNCLKRLKNCLLNLKLDLTRRRPNKKTTQGKFLYNVSWLVFLAWPSVGQCPTDKQ